MQTIGPGHLFEDSVVIPRAQQDLRRALGELDAEDFYRGDKGVQKAQAAQQALEAEVKDKGIEILQVLVRRYTYDQRYQQAIEQRKIQDQTVYKNEAEAKSATAAAAKNKVVAEGAAAVQIELARGDGEVKKLEADADLYRRKRAAEGDLLVKLAEAQGTELENQALRGVHVPSDHHRLERLQRRAAEPADGGDQGTLGSGLARGPGVQDARRERHRRRRHRGVAHRSCQGGVPPQARRRDHERGQGAP